MIKIERINTHLSNDEYMKNHTRWRNESLDWTRENLPTTVSSQRQFFANLKPNHEFFTIVDTMGAFPAKLVGTCGLTDINHAHKTAEFSMLVGSEHRKQGYAYRGMKELLKYGFNELKMNLIFGETFVYREASHALSAIPLPHMVGFVNPGAVLYEKLGFHLEGRHRTRYIKNGHFVDSIIYSLTKDEFVENEKALT